MEFVFINSSFVQGLKENLQRDTIIAKNIKRELILRSNSVNTKITNETSLAVLSNDFLALCNAGFYIDQEYSLDTAEKFADTIVSEVPSPNLFDSSFQQDEEDVSVSLIKILHSFSLLNSRSGNTKLKAGFIDWMSSLVGNQFQDPDSLSRLDVCQSIWMNNILSGLSVYSNNTHPLL